MRNKNLQEFRRCIYFNLFISVNLGYHCVNSGILTVPKGINICMYVQEEKFLREPKQNPYYTFILFTYYEKEFFASDP